MTRIRIIPRLDIKGPNLVKGIHLEGLRVLGLPEVFAEKYFQDGADELIYMDIVASLYGRNNLEDIVKRTVANVFIPITVGGGVRSIEDIRRLLRAGADKVAINTAAIKNPKFITEAARIFGSQCIVLSIEAMRRGPEKYEAYTDNGREETGKDVMEWAREAVDLGVGEILITSIDREGTGNGYDLDVVRQVACSVPVPVIACGGAGNIQHVEDVIRQGKVDAASAGSIFHYHVLDQTGVAKRAEGNIEFLKQYVASSGSILKHITPLSVSKLKAHLIGAGINCVKGSLPLQPTGSRQDEGRLVTVNCDSDSPLVVIMEYGRSNLFNIERALKSVGAKVAISSDPSMIAAADGLVLAGVGAFGDGMVGLQERGLVDPIRESAAAAKPLLGICLGMQLFMTESEEFGLHAGLDLIKGRVVRLQQSLGTDAKVKIPHIGWNELRCPGQIGDEASTSIREYWSEAPILRGVTPGEMAYFVHSYIAVPDDRESVVSETQYGCNTFCSVIQQGNLVGCQFHPERSGWVGLLMLQNFVESLRG